MIKQFAFESQKILCKVSFFFSCLMDTSKSFDWAIGPEEIAGVASALDNVIPNSRLFIQYRNRFFESSKKKKRPPSVFFRWITGPIALGWIACRSKGVVFVGAQGYLIHSVDQRSFEFRFLRSKGVKVVCVLLGSDIRSLRLMTNKSEATGIESIADYVVLSNPEMNLDEHDAVIKTRCEAINEHADLIFTSPWDQESYLRQDSLVFQPFLPDQYFGGAEDKFDNLENVRIVHAPSAPFIKGTPLVRAAVTRLRLEGYKFVYEELQRLPNSEVRKRLVKAHIVVNELYAFIPGVFGIEAMASNAVLVTRASETLDPSLPGSPSSAWVPTEPWMIYDVLKGLLAHPEGLRAQAKKGYEWAREHASSSTQGTKVAYAVSALLESVHEDIIRG